MSKAKFEAARKLINEKKYDEARTILKTIDLHLARDWEARLDHISSTKIDIEHSLKATKRKKPRKRYLGLTGSAWTILLLLCAFVYIIVQSPDLTEEEQQATQTARTVIANTTASIIVLTPATATSTITDTPLPSETPEKTISPSSSNIAPRTSSPPEVFYTTANVNARECPQLDCNVISVIPSGTMLAILPGFTQGESDNLGNDIWRQTILDGREVYIHSAFLSVTAPTPTPFVIQQPISTPPPAPMTQPRQWICVGDLYNCRFSDFSSEAEMLDYFNSCPGDPSDLDRNDNGIPCEQGLS